MDRQPARAREKYGIATHVRPRPHSNRPPACRSVKSYALPAIRPCSNVADVTYDNASDLTTRARTDDHAAVIRSVVEDWVVLRDSGRWDDFASVWHDDGWMTATWFQGPFRDFIRVSREGFDRGVEISHFLGGFSCEVSAPRAIAQTKMKIEQRASVHGVEVDVTCSGRFYDFFELRDDRWAIVRRQPIYERDRMDVVDPALSVRLDDASLRSFPSGYRHLAYAQEQVGYSVMHGLPGLTGNATSKLYEEGADWLAGSPEPGKPMRNETSQGE